MIGMYEVYFVRRNGAELCARAAKREDMVEWVIRSKQLRPLEMLPDYDVPHADQDT